jgi:hypothetical protein
LPDSSFKSVVFGLLNCHAPSFTPTSFTAAHDLSVYSYLYLSHVPLDFLTFLSV